MERKPIAKRIVLGTLSLLGVLAGSFIMKWPVDHKPQKTIGEMAEAVFGTSYASADIPPYEPSFCCGACDSDGDPGSGEGL